MRPTQTTEQCCKAILKELGIRSLEKLLAEDRIKAKLIMMEECQKFGVSYNKIKTIMETDYSY